MNDESLNRFLRARRVGVLSIPRSAGKPPLSSPVWYDYNGSCFRIHVEAASAKAKAIARNGGAPVSFTIQSEVPPYRYAIVYGRARVVAGGDADLRRRVARRYFGRLVGDMYITQEEQKGPAANQLATIEIHPDRFVTHDFRPEAGLTGRLYFALYRWLRPVPA
jgi:nitroimidazol reductase NimA-like FMN-containing flavoprotein (pyridoxamine 5'-phosphate oxidase superfamily)